MVYVFDALMNTNYYILAMITIKDETLCFRCRTAGVVGRPSTHRYINNRTGYTNHVCARCMNDLIVYWDYEVERFTEL